MKLTIKKIEVSEIQKGREHYEITTPVEVKQEEEIRYNNEILKLIGKDDYCFDKDQATGKWRLFIKRRVVPIDSMSFATAPVAMAS